MRYVLLASINDVWVIGRASDDPDEIREAKGRTKAPTVVVDTEAGLAILPVEFSPTLEVETFNSIWQFDERSETWTRWPKGKPRPDPLAVEDYVFFEVGGTDLVVHRDCPTCGDRSTLVSSPVVTFRDLRIPA